MSWHVGPHHLALLDSQGGVCSNLVFLHVSSFYMDTQPLQSDLLYVGRTGSIFTIHNPKPTSKAQKEYTTDETASEWDSITSKNKYYDTATLARVNREA